MLVTANRRHLHIKHILLILTEALPSTVMLTEKLTRSTLCLRAVFHFNLGSPSLT